MIEIDELYENEQRTDLIQGKINWHKMKIIVASAQIEYHEKEIKRLQNSY